MADAPPPTPSELLRMVTELQQANQHMAEANQRMAEENQRMQQQIQQIANARLEHNDNRHGGNANDENQSQPTHVSETPQDDDGRDPHNNDASLKDEEEEPDNSAGPFTADIMNFQLPRQFTLPTTLNPYDGLGDPKQHIKKFRSIMIELAKQFEDHFAASAIYLHDSDYLTTVKQGPQESLKDYITRFTKIAMRIPDLHPEVHLHAIKSGLRPGKFQEAIAVAKPKTLAEFREKAKGQINIEELRQARKAEKSAATKEDDKPRDNKKTFRPTPRYETYTQFNTKRDDIIKEILNSKLIKPPRKADSYPEPKNVDKSKYCTFHQKYGHTTDECVIAKDLLERLARQGHLDKYISGHMQKRSASISGPPPGGPSSSSKDKEKAPAQPRGIINCISGGYAGGGQTSSARKRTYRAMLALGDTTNNPQSVLEIPEMTFCPTDFNCKDTNLDDPVVISLQLGDLIVRKVLLDPGSSADVLFFTTFEKMKLSTNILQPSAGDLVGFSGERVPVMGSVWLQTTLGEQPLSKTHDIQYLVVDCFSPYNLILGRPFLNRFTAIVSTVHLCVKFPVQDNLIATIHGDLQEARHCYNTSLKPIKRGCERRINSITSEQPTLAELDPRADFQDRPLPNEELTKIMLTDDPTKHTFIGTSVKDKEREKLIQFLQKNADLFAWTSGDMPGIDPSIITHKLAINPAARPISQKKRNLGAEKRMASMVEAKKLIDANFIREIRFTTWLANVVMVKKNNDNSCGYGTLSFMDAYSGYNQILMHPSDQEKTAFITEYGNYCYNVMPFGLKNAGATYQRLMNRVFEKQIGRNIEVYVDDMVAKTKVGHSHIDDLEEIFGQIRAYNMRLNPEKCAFGVIGGKFLGFMLTSRGIEANPEKCQAILDMNSPTNIKEVQRLTGRLAALSRFLPCLATKSFNFFRCLRKNTKFQWDDNCEMAFQSLKQFLSKPPVLQKPDIGEPLYLYLSVTDIAVSSVLVAEKGKTQQPVYFVSKSLQNAELRYLRLEKLAYALVLSARRLRPYFQSHTIYVRTSQPLRQILAKPELAGRLIRWSIELFEFDIQYQPRGSVKSQYLADFVVELTGTNTDIEDAGWILFVDGASNPHGSGAGILLENAEGVAIEHSLRFSFKASNNQAEYEALLAGLRLAIELHIVNLKVYCDSLLVVQQVNQSFQTKDPVLSKYVILVKNLMDRFSKIEIYHIARDQNHRADILSKLASTQSHTASLLQSTLHEPSIDIPSISHIEQEVGWQKPYIQYLKSGEVPQEIQDVKKFKRQASFFTLLNNLLYRRGYSRPLLKCLDRTEADLALAEVHEGVCGIHSGARSLAQKILRAGFYWPTIWEDSRKKVRTCDRCQKHAPNINIPAEDLHQSTVSWPFNHWGIDILGPFPTAPRQVKYLVVAIDYFSKWIEAQPLARITSVQMISFVWQKIICRFGIPRHIVTDNGRQFTDHNFKSFLQNLKIKQHFSSVEHPQSNGLAEAANKVVLQALRKKLDDAKGLWAELVPEILWGYNTSPHSTTKETPFRLVYGSEAMIPVEVSQSSFRTQAEDHEHARRAELDLVEEVRTIAAVRHKALQQRLGKRHSKRVKPRSFNVGDLVLRKTEEARKPPTHGKLAAAWEGPYRIHQVLGKGAYRLEQLDGTNHANNRCANRTNDSISVIRP
ncbi:uncharacterized protein LOC130941176 [Arachis stenosperma]|uniref:uncharacterized protein LOC130941176 n=1 Tax=Arachis stenosperma TaxID=217475 RepID=UPI0025AD098F|nr:uncharacterized protein LOC130941176 [Arachis stenosperma]